MSQSNPTAPAVIDPKRNPAYPARIHWGERAELQAKLEGWRKKLAEAAAKLKVVGDHSDRGFHEYVYAQITGGVDQVADCVRRMPGETGDLYAEDKHRLEQAEQALERLFRKWEQGR